ncbi:MAG: hypothetical protein ABIG70_04460 [Pseudomonadota bacterium]|jgi:uncharacterized protein YfaP (DUF2135 family)
MKKSVRFFIQFLLLFATCSVFAVHAATISISPSGNVSANNVPVIVTVTTTSGGTPTFIVKVNGEDVSTYFNQGALISTSGNTTTAKVEYLFGGGTYTVSATAQVTGESAVSASTSFTVPGDLQESRKNTVLGKVNEFLHQWDAYDFHRWSSAGNLATFSTRIWEPAMQVYVDPGYLSSGGSAAEYVEAYIWKYIWTIYEQDLVISAEPQSEGVSHMTLWHEMIHAVSHGAQVSGAANRLSGDDHVYVGWAESCTFGFNKLKLFETKAKTYGIGNPTPTQAAEARNYWKQFIAETKGSTYAELGAITAAQKQALQNLIGFSCDANAIKAGYLSVGYSPLYFADLSVVIISPPSGTQTNENQVDVEASFTNNEPDLTVDRVGFSVNGAIQEAPRAGNTFGTTAVLKTGDNSIIAGVMTTDGQVFQSTPITVKSDALNNTYHARISWDKNDTDVDLHFSWSGGSECYYSNKTPIWGSAATSPRLDVDDTNGYGPENITIGALPGSGTYALRVHYYSDHGKGSTNVIASIYKDGVAIFSDSRTMSNGENWTLYQFTIP